MKWGLTILLLALGTIPARADSSEIPRFNVEAYCRAVASLGGQTSQMIYSGCLDMEQSSYDGLKPVWSDLPASIRSYCIRVARLGGGGAYNILSGCVQMEVAAGRDNARRQFRY